MSRFTSLAVLKLKKLLVIIAAAGAAAAIAIGSRNQFRSDPLAEETSETSLAPAPVQQPAAQPAAPTRSSADPVRAAVPATAHPASVSSSDALPRVHEATTYDQQTDKILRAAAAAYESVRTLQASFVQQIDNPLIGTHLSSAGTLYQQKPDLLLLKFSDPAGDLIMSDGRYFWIYYPSVDAKQVIRAPMSAAGSGGVDLQAQFLGDPVRRFNSTLDARETIAGRSVNVVTMVPRQPLGYKKLKVWIDTRDSLARRFEITEENGNVRRFELRDLRVNTSLPATLFHFTPPANARVIDRG